MFAPKQACPVSACACGRTSGPSSRSNWGAPAAQETPSEVRQEESLLLQEPGQAALQGHPSRC